MNGNDRKYIFGDKSTLVQARKTCPKKVYKKKYILYIKHFLLITHLLM